MLHPLLPRVVREPTRSSSRVARVPPLSFTPSPPARGVGLVFPGQSQHVVEPSVAISWPPPTSSAQRKRAGESGDRALSPLLRKAPRRMKRLPSELRHTLSPGSQGGWRAWSSPCRAVFITQIRGPVSMSKVGADSGECVYSLCRRQSESRSVVSDSVWLTPRAIQKISLKLPSERYMKGEFKLAAGRWGNKQSRQTGKHL